MWVYVSHVCVCVCVWNTIFKVFRFETAKRMQSAKRWNGFVCINQEHLVAAILCGKKKATRAGGNCKPHNARLVTHRVKAKSEWHWSRVMLVERIIFARRFNCSRPFICYRWKLFWLMLLQDSCNGIMEMCCRVFWAVGVCVRGSARQAKAETESEQRANNLEQRK